MTKRCYWLDSKNFSQPEFRNLSTPIKQLIECIQIQTGSLVLILVYIFICLIPKQTNSPMTHSTSLWYSQKTKHYADILRNRLFLRNGNFCFSNVLKNILFLREKVSDGESPPPSLSLIPPFSQQLFLFSILYRFLQMEPVKSD